MLNKFSLYAFLYLLFVIYGSLVPLEYKPIPDDQAIAQFKNIKYLKLGIESRADWIANILLYIPLAFLSLAGLTIGQAGFFFKRIFSPLVVSAFCLVVAFIVEYYQQFFPPRTVSINDLIAEAIGTGVGIVIWQAFGLSFIKLYKNISLGDFVSFKSASIFYLLIYLVLSLFPFDFVTSFSELDMKLAAGNDHFILSAESLKSNVTRTLVKWLVEILVLLPFGMLIGWWPYISHRLFLSILIGFSLGVFLETAQLFLVSGAADGESVLTRMLGTAFGTQLFLRGSRQNWHDWVKWLQPVVLALVVPYILLVMAINGWFSGVWSGQAQAAIKLAGTSFLPFYYFYYTTESVALVSLLSNAGTYLPIGLFYGLWSLTGRRGERIHWFFVGLSALFLAVIIETGKLFLANKHADPTDILIAFIAASGGYAFFDKILTLVIGGKVKYRHKDEIDNEDVIVQEEIKTAGIQTKPVLLLGAKADEYVVNKRACWFSIFLLLAVVWGLFEYPLGAVALAIFLSLYSYLLFLFPQAWLFVVPALLPVMDFTPWTGRFFFDEFDLLVLTTLMMSYWRMPYLRHLHSKANFKTILIFGMFGFFYLISLLRGLLPLQAIDANAFTNYYSNYNALRVGKGVAWFFLLLPFLIQAMQKYGVKTGYYFGYGVLLGLSGVIGFAIIERLVFTGLFDFSTDYRVNALFSTMHTGGGHIESYLALSLPFIALLFLNTKAVLLSRICGMVLFVTGIYVLLVTFSRGGYIGFGIGFLVLVTGFLMSFKNRLHGMKSPLFLVFLLMTIIAAVAVPVFQGSLIKQRFSVAHQDKDIRENHWKDAIAMMSDTLGTTGFGMGVGSFPRTHFWLNAEDSHPATYKIDTENDNAFLKLTGGDWLYFGQFINIKPQTSYRLVLDVRSEDSKAGFNILLCEKSLQYSIKCNSTASVIGGKTWTHVEQLIDSGDIGSAGMAGPWLKRPVQLSLYNGGGAGKVIDVDNIKFLEPDGKNILANGDFSKATDFWFFSTEKHNPWHIFNIWVQVLFDLGWFGLTAFLLLLAVAFFNLFKRMSEDSIAPILLSALSGFIVIGFVDSPFDAPRLTLFFFIVLFLSVSDNKVKA